MAAHEPFNYQAERFSPFSDVDETTYTWKPLEFLNTFRFLISFVLIALIYSNLLFEPLGSRDNTLFFAVSAVYLALSVIFALMLRWRQPRFTLQVAIQLTTDVIAIILLMHASGGVSSGVGNLLIITVTSGSIVLTGRHAMLFASLTTLAILGEQGYAGYFHIDNSSSYTQAGLLGLALFIIAAITLLFANRIRESEALAKMRGVDLANMAELTEHVIQRMQTGIVVVDSFDRIRLINESAWYMLGMPSTASSPPLGHISLPLARQLIQWRENPEMTPTEIQPANSQANVMPRFARLSQKDNPGTLIFLEDTSNVAQKAQQLQLASLGRLTASIAHEIRNPLGAISHAGQLLAESPELDENDVRLTQIITDQSSRMNTIIESVLQLGRRTSTKPELIHLAPFLKAFVRDFLSSHAEPDNIIEIRVEPDDLLIRFDITHLQQILTNLCENGLRHSEEYNKLPKLVLQGSVSLDMSRPYLDVIDQGSGIDEETAEHIFEPFYTTATSGSGLGLYISRELAECNQSNLKYFPNPEQGSTFRLSFQDPRRQIH